MKFLILGLDALEYHFVEAWHLRNLMQKEYGELGVPVDRDLQIPLSPQVWATFLMGQVSHIDRFADGNPLIEATSRILNFGRRHLPFGFGLKLRLQNRLHKRARFWRQKLEKATFLDLTRSKEVNAPYYSFDDSMTGLMHDFRNRRLNQKEAIERVKRSFRKRKEQFIKETSDLADFDVAFFYEIETDTLQHLSYMHPSIVKTHYEDLDFYIAKLKAQIPKNFVFIIVSDHGFNLKIGTHSSHGFYSSNKPLNPKPKCIRDFYHIFTKQQRKRQNLHKKI